MSSLTAPLCERTIEVMLRRSFPICLVLALVAASMATSALANCMADTAMTVRAQMACCQAGHHAMAGSAEDCCKAERQKQQQLSAATHEVVRATLPPPALIAAIIPGFNPARLLRASTIVSARDVLKGPSVPAYFLDSALLI